MKTCLLTLLACLLLLCPALTHAQSDDLSELLENFDIELDEDSAAAIKDWIKGIDNINFDWSDEFTAKDRKKLSRSHEELISLRNKDQARFHLYAGRGPKRTTEMLLVVEMPDQTFQLTMTGDFDVR